MTMQVVTRGGTTEPVRFDKILDRIAGLTDGLHASVDPAAVSKKVIEEMADGITTRELDKLASEVCASMMTTHPDYGILGARILVSDLHKETSDSFLQTVEALYGYVDPKTGKHAPLVAEDVRDIVRNHPQEIDTAIDYGRDFQYDFFGFKTLERSYLLKIDGAIAERPQHMIMRVAIGIHKTDLQAAFETYEMMSKGFFTHATPTLFNAGTPKPQMSSCFLVAAKDDSLEGIYDTLKECALISKHAGGIGLHVHNVRSQGAYIRGTNGSSNGLVPMLRVFNATARYVDQGGGKRKGSCAVYLEPWHPDIFDFLDLRKNHGAEERRARDLFYALWTPDLFMERVEQDGMWSLMDPDECPGLADCWGPAFRELYETYEAQGKHKRQVPARKLWETIIQSQIETGTPYMLYKDAANGKSNQQNLGTIKSSNLCTEIIEYSAPDETAVCNLASIAVNRFVRGDRSYDFKGLHEAAKVVTRNLNKVIDLNFYPTAATRRSNMRHRPVGIGVQGYADMYALMRFPFDSWEAREQNRRVAETIYHGALEASMEQAQEKGSYETFAGSPASKGILQFDMWGVKPDSGLWDWRTLRQDIALHGLRNSLLVAPMPTASTSQILGNNECFEPFTSNLYTRRTLSGEFVVLNKHLVRDLIELGIWNERIKQQIIVGKGSVQHIDEIPADIRELYKTVWEIRQRVIIDMAADRGAYIDQSQSLNIHLADPNFAKISSMHFYGWKKGLKTGMYYLRTQAAASALQFTVDPEEQHRRQASPVVAFTDQAAAADDAEEQLACSIDSPDDCMACGA